MRLAYIWQCPFCEYVGVSRRDIEIKGYKNEFYQEKCNQFPKDKKLIIIDKNSIKKYIDFAILKIGKAFWNKLYR